MILYNYIFSFVANGQFCSICYNFVAGFVANLSLIINDLSNLLHLLRKIGLHSIYRYVHGIYMTLFYYVCVTYFL